MFGVRLAARVMIVACALSTQLFAQQAPLPKGSTSQNAPNNNESLADIARRVRVTRPADVQMTEQQTKDLFAALDGILAFAAEDSGFPKRSNVKRRMVGQGEVEEFVRERLNRADVMQRVARAELTMKKFGFLPREFHLSEFAVKSSGQQVAGFYDEDSKSISLVNWVSIEKQGPILAHELTHALQDQNYDLKTWAGGKPGTSEEDSNDERTNARRAVVEGQAMVVYIDFLLAPVGRSLKNTPGVIARLEEPAVSAVIDSELFHNAPMIMREAGAFPYREGLIFEAELLSKGGKPMAFAGAFARPPRNTHEVLQPRAYLEQERLPSTSIPDLHDVVTAEYEKFDSGAIGELDVRAFLKQFGERKVAPELASAWQGGSYIAYTRKSAAGTKLSPADLSLLYVSRWKSPEAAQTFARIYTQTVSKRYATATVQPLRNCSEGRCPSASANVMTEEGPVVVEQWPDNSVIVSEGFDYDTAARLSSAVRATATQKHAAADEEELGLRLNDLPAFRAFQTEIGLRILQQLAAR